ncbi:MAG: ferric reductase-like transmembrane domain-containing protein [Chloroflexota bacterium]|jgi:predicted ferric reductase
MKKYAGTLFIIACVLLTVAVWLVFPPQNDGRENFARAYAGEVIGSVNIVLMAFSLFLSARPKWVEPFFGGLDKMYVIHRHTSTAALLLIFVHVLTVPITLTGWALGNYLAVFAFTGIVAIAMVSLSPRIPFLNRLTGGTYEGWKRLKKFIGIFFIAGFLHSLTVPRPLNAFIAINWVQLFFILGAVSYLYTEVFGRFFKKHLPYTVAEVKHPTPSTTEVTLRPKKDSIPAPRAGQFIFVRFPSHRLLDESHPFTLSSAPHEDVLRVTVKASGDFTRALFAHLQPGMEAVVEGAYGMFDYKTGGQKQIWIAGGIGLTPFLSFLRGMDALEKDVTFYYVVRHREEALFLDELEAAAKRHPRLKVHIRFSAVDGPLRLDAVLENAGGDVRGYDVYLCGPLPMIQAFERGFREAGIPARNIHFEEFNFR